MFWRGVLGYLPVNIVQAIAGFGAIVVFTRLLSPEAYGHYALAFSIAALVHLIGLTWIEAAMARFYAAEPEGEARSSLFATLYRAFGLFCLIAPIPTGLILAFAPIDHGLKLAVAAGLAAAVARSLLKLAQERRRAAGEVRGFALYDMIQTGGGFLLGAGLALIGWGAAAPFAGAGAATAICLVWALRPELALVRGGRFDAARLKTYAAYGLPISLSLMLSLAMASTDRFVLAFYTGDAAVGAYHAGYSLASRVLDIIFLWLAMAAGPAQVMAYEQGGETALRRTSSEQASLMVLIAVPAAVGLALVARPLAALMVGPELSEPAARVAPWIAFGALLSGVTTHYLNHAFTLSKRTGRQIAAFGIPAAANLALCFVLIPRYGLDGAAWATVASFAIGLVASYVLMRGCLPLPVPWATIAGAGVSAGAMALAVTRVPAVGGPGEVLAKAAVGALVYALVALALDAGGARTQAARLVRTLRASPQLGGAA
jgi:O-antigen/teichoic acid export membrane protein